MTTSATNDHTSSGPTASSITGVILAAGRGNRMGALPTRLPKPVLPVLGQPLVYHQLRTMASVGIGRAVIVVGERGYEIVRELERMPDPGVHVDYVEQREALGIAHSVGRLERSIDQPFLLFLGDIYFVAPQLGRMLRRFEDQQADAVVAAIEESTPEPIRKNFCILEDDSGRAVRVVEKPRQPRSLLKGVGLYLFRPVVFDAIRRTPRTAMRDEYEITDSIQIMIDDGCAVHACRCVQEDVNVTKPGDLLEVNLRALQAHDLERWIAPGAGIENGAVLERCVVGDKARIGAGSSIRRSVIFAGADVPKDAVIEDCIVTDQEVFKV